MRSATRSSNRALVPLELITGVLAVIGGVLLVAAPDGSLLQADTAALDGTPFDSWRIPGLLLLSLVGAGFLVTGFAQWRGTSLATTLSVLAGTGLVAFEVVEQVWLGFQPLELVFAGVGVAVVVLAARSMPW